SIIL
ncbi:hypothetical protein DERP_008729, partial [Dermatophagoides pteronyssinus]